MDLGEPFKQEMRIKPGEDGSFIIVFGEAIDYGRTPAPFIGFTCIDDLLIWMAKHGAKVGDARVTKLSEGDVVKGAPDGVVQVERGTLNAIRRTTAAEIIREREAQAATYAGPSPAA